MSDPNRRNDPIFAVVGAPRSGSSLTMSILEAAGIDPVCDPGNRGSSYETSLTLDLPNEPKFLEDCYGEAVKILDPLEFTPPRGLPYRFIWTTRDSHQQAASHVKFMRLIGGDWHTPVNRRQLAASIRRDEKKALRRLRAYPDSKLIVVKFEDLIRFPRVTCEKIAGFIGADPYLVPAMASKVIKRSPDCLPNMLERLQHA